MTWSSSTLLHPVGRASSIGVPFPPPPDFGPPPTVRPIRKGTKETASAENASAEPAGMRAETAQRAFATQRCLHVRQCHH